MELEGGRERRAAAEAMFGAMDRGGFDLAVDEIDRLNDALAPDR